ncbi:MAG: MmcQ/YjbR family DNA-binding protein [Acidobacteriota bacterium]|nr:MmcQ/YjbR family DNA-binding protein [Acidobacteriota bacterium]
MAKDHLERVRKFCLALPEVEEKLSHDAPTFFVKKKVFVMFADNHHNDGRIAIWCAASAEIQQALIEAEPDKFFRPPYVGVRGWIGINLDQVDDTELASHIRQAWLMIAPVKLHAALNAPARGE